jgi:hypothetical protein
MRGGRRRRGDHFVEREGRAGQSSAIDVPLAHKDNIWSFTT